MARKDVSLETIEDFLRQKRIALVGISRNKRDIGSMLWKTLRERGCEVSLVNPNASELLGQRCFSTVRQIIPAPDAALLLTSPELTERIVRECHEAGIKRLWMYRGGPGGAVNEAAVQFCREHGIAVIPGECPFMYLDPVRHVHWVHRALSRISGHYPSREARAASAD